MASCGSSCGSSRSNQAAKRNQSTVPELTPKQTPGLPGAGRENVLRAPPAVIHFLGPWDPSELVERAPSYFSKKFLTKTIGGKAATTVKNFSRNCWNELRVAAPTKTKGCAALLSFLRALHDNAPPALPTCECRDPPSKMGSTAFHGAVKITPQRPSKMGSTAFLCAVKITPQRRPRQHHEWTAKRNVSETVSA